MRFSIIILSFFMVVSCNSQLVTNTEYKLMNDVVDSLVKQSRKDSIGLKIETLNGSWLSEELIMNPGFNYYERGKAVNKCPENNIKDGKFSNFNYAAFKVSKSSIDPTKITNNNITTNFMLKTDLYKEKWARFTNDNPTINKKDLLEGFWTNERGQSIYQISTPIFSDDKKIAVIFTHALNMGVVSWTFKKSENNKWIILCTEQITIE